MVIFGHRQGGGGSNPPKIPKLPFLGKIFKFQGGGGVRTPAPPPLDPRMIYTLWVPTMYVLCKNIKNIMLLSTNQIEEVWLIMISGCEALPNNKFSPLWYYVKRDKS